MPDETRGRKRGGGGKMAGLALLVAAGFGLVVYAARDASDTTQPSEEGSDSLASLTDAKIKERLAAAGWAIQRDSSRVRFLHLHLRREGASATVIFAEYRDEQIATQQVTANREPGWATRLEGRRLLSAKVLTDDDASQHLLDVITGAASPQPGAP